MFAQNQGSTVETHLMRAEPAVAAEGVALGVTGQRYGGCIGFAVVDDQIHQTGLAVSAAVGVDMRALGVLNAGFIDGRTHQTVPEQHCKVVGAGLKGAVLEQAVVGGSQGVVEDDTIGNGAERAQAH